APGFGGINIEDVAAPACFEIERALRERLDIPVFHDDQHGTAVVVLAALINGCRAKGRRLEDLRVAVLGAGAAGVAWTSVLLSAGVRDVVVVDRQGVLGPDRDLTGTKAELAAETNAEGRTGDVRAALAGADAFVGVSGPGIVEPAWLGDMADRAIVLALANPDPEVDPDAVPDNVAVVATGRSGDPSQVNNVLAFPGIFRGLLDARARGVDDATKLAAARALAALVDADDVAAGVLVPSPFDTRVAPSVASAVTEHLTASAAARQTAGGARGRATSTESPRGGQKEGPR